MLNPLYGRCGVVACGSEACEETRIMRCGENSILEGRSASFWYSGRSEGTTKDFSCSSTCYDCSRWTRSERRGKTVRWV